MKKDLRPKYYPEAKVTCACGNTWTTGSTKEEIRTEVCSACHPFFTGEQQRLIDMEGQVDRFYKKLQARQEYVEDKKQKESSKVSPDRPIEELELGSRYDNALKEVGIENVGQLLKKMEGGESAILDIVGVGRKTLIDMKKQLRKMGYDLPEAVEEISV